MNESDEIVEELYSVGHAIDFSHPLSSKTTHILDAWNAGAGMELLDLLGHKVTLADKIGKPYCVVEESLSSILSRTAIYLVPNSRFLNAVASKFCFLAGVMTVMSRNGTVVTYQKLREHLRDLESLCALTPVCNILGDEVLNSTAMVYIGQLITSLDGVCYFDLYYIANILKQYAVSFRSQAAEHRSGEMKGSRAAWRDFVKDAMSSDIGALF